MGLPRSKSSVVRISVIASLIAIGMLGVVSAGISTIADSSLPPWQRLTAPLDLADSAGRLEPPPSTASPQITAEEAYERGYRDTPQEVVPVRVWLATHKAIGSVPDEGPHPRESLSVEERVERGNSLGPLELDWGSAPGTLVWAFEHEDVMAPFRGPSGDGRMQRSRVVVVVDAERGNHVATYTEPQSP